MNKKAINGFYLILATLLSLFMPALSFPSATPLLLATDDTPGNPWIMGGGTNIDQNLPGIEIELYRLVAQRLNLTLKIMRMPWKRCLSELQEGRLDGVFPASFKPERMVIGVFPFTAGNVDQSRKSRNSAYYLYRIKGTPVTWDGAGFINLDRMARRTIGVPLGWSITDDLRGTGADILERPRPLDLLIMLTRGGLAGVVCLDTVADTYLRQKKQSLAQIEKVYPAIAEKAYYLMLSHQFAAAHPALAEKIWDSIAALKTEAAYAAILNRYTQ